MARGVDDVHAGDLGLFAAVFRVSRHNERFAVGAQHGAGAFVEPLGRRAATVGLGPAAFEPQTKHAHAVGECFGFRFRVHLVATRGAAVVRQACSADEAPGRLGMINRRKKAPGDEPA